MLVGKRDQDYILTCDNLYELLIKQYDIVIAYSSDLLKYGNFSHGMSTVRHKLKYINTIFNLKCNNEELKIEAHNSAVIIDSLYMGLYKGTERERILIETINNCKGMKQIINQLSEK